MADKKRPPFQIQASQKAVKISERDEQILALRRRGWAYRRIASALGVGRSTAHGVVTKYLAVVGEEAVKHTEAIRAQELERLDACTDAIWEQVEAGHLGAIDRAIRISAQRAKLLGLDAPVRVQVDSAQDSADTFGAVLAGVYGFDESGHGTD